MSKLQTAQFGGKTLAALYNNIEAGVQTDADTQAVCYVQLIVFPL